MSFQIFQYLQPVVTLWTCVPISDEIITETLYFWELDFVVLNFPLFIPKMHVFVVHCAVMSPRYLHYHQRKPCKTIYEKVRYVPNSLA